MIYYDLSIIIPCHNEVKRLPNTMEKIRNHIAHYPERITEIILVENGSSDKTPELVQSYADAWCHVKAIRLATASKGAAIAAGIETARGAYIYMCDADLSTPIGLLEEFWTHRNDADIIIGWRRCPVGEPINRRITSKLFQNLVRSITGLKYHDTQCGFKLIRRYPAALIFFHVTTSGFAFDVEALMIASIARFTVYEMPVYWRYDGRSTIRPLRDGYRMLKDIIHIRHMWGVANYIPLPTGVR